MEKLSLEEEIQKASERIKDKEEKINSESNQLQKRIRKFTNWSWFFVLLGFIVMAFAILYFLFKNNENGFGLNLLGDFLAGTVASIWSLAGLFFIYVAFLGQKLQLLSQQLEIMYSQLEVKYTRLELNAQKKEMKLQNETLRIQRFENTFFEMLTLLGSIVNSLDAQFLRNKATGRDCFELFYSEFPGILIKKFSKIKNFEDVEEATIKQMIFAYGILYINRRSDLSHYFRTLYRIIKIVDNSTIKNKRQYIAIIRSQLSSYEQILLFYNSLNSIGEKFKPFIEKYQIFKNIDESLLFNLDHRKEYNDSAYKEPEN